MIDIDSVIKSEWFSFPSPFRATYTAKNPRVCVITGGNASGKSLLRKLIYNEYQDNKTELMHISQAARCRSGIVRGFMYGSEEDESTGFNSTKTILKLIQTANSRDNQYGILLDEPEIGCGEELQAGLGFRMMCAIKDSCKNMDTCFVISHSKQFVQQLFALNPSHIHLMSSPHDYMSLTNWCKRDIVPLMDLEGLVVRNHAGWQFVQSIINKRKK